MAKTNPAILAMMLLCSLERKRSGFDETIVGSNATVEERYAPMIRR